MARKTPTKTTKKEVAEAHQQALAEIESAPTKAESQLDKKKAELIDNRTSDYVRDHMKLLI